MKKNLVSIMRAIRIPICRILTGYHPHRKVFHHKKVYLKKVAQVRKNLSRHKTVMNLYKNRIKTYSI